MNTCDMAGSNRGAITATGSKDSYASATRTTDGRLAPARPSDFIAVELQHDMLLIVIFGFRLGCSDLISCLPKIKVKVFRNSF